MTEAELKESSAQYLAELDKALTKELSVEASGYFDTQPYIEFIESQRGAF